MSWSWEARDLDQPAVQADARLMDDLACRRPVAADDPAAAILVALAREVDTIPIPPGWFVTGSAPYRWSGARSRARRAAAGTGVAAAVGMLVVGGAAAAVTGVPIGSLINEVVRSVFDGGSHTTSADLIAAQLADAEAALANGNIKVAAQILEDIKTRVDLSDPDVLPPTLVDEIQRLEARIDAAAAQPSVPVIASMPSPVAPDATSGGGADDPSGQNQDHGSGSGQGIGAGRTPARGEPAASTGHDQARGSAGSPSSSTRNDRPSDPADVPASDPASASGGLTQDGLSLVSASPASPSVASPSVASPSLASPSVANPSLASPSLASPSRDHSGSADD